MSQLAAPTVDESDDLALGCERADEWKSFVVRFLGVFIVLLVAEAALNFVANPAGIYPTTILRPLKFNTRYVKPRLLADLPYKPEAIILGSSRAMKISPSAVQEMTGLRAFNSAVDNAAPEDDYALLRYEVEELGVRPKLLIIGMELETFNENLPLDENLIHSPQLRAYLSDKNMLKIRWDQFIQLFSLRETRLSLRALSLLVLPYPPSHMRLESDGYLVYDQTERDRASGQFDLKSHLPKESDVALNFKGFGRVSERKLNYLRQTIEYARMHGMAVKLFITPMHPEALNIAKTMGFDARHEEAVAALSRMASETGSQFDDFSSVERFGGDPNDFFDGWHYGEKNARLICERLMRTNAVQ